MAVTEPFFTLILPCKVLYIYITDLELQKGQLPISLFELHLLCLL